MRATPRLAQHCSPGEGWLPCKTTWNTRALTGKNGWQKLVLIDQSLQRQGVTTQLTLVGSAAGILAGQPGRTSIYLDVWKPRSCYQFQALKKAVEDAGLLFDPKSTLEPDTPYIQLVEPGIAETGAFESTEPLEQFSALRLERPPIANLIAAKLVRAEPRDLEDIAFLMSRYCPARPAIERAINTMPGLARKRASENLVYLDAMGEPKAISDAPHCPSTRINRALLARSPGPSPGLSQATAVAGIGRPGRICGQRCPTIVDPYGSRALPDATATDYGVPAPWMVLSQSQQAQGTRGTIDPMPWCCNSSTGLFPSAAEPQPRAEKTGIWKTGKCTDSYSPVFHIPVFMSSCGPARDFTAACEQLRRLQYDRVIKRAGQPDPSGRSGTSMRTLA